VTDQTEDAADAVMLLFEANAGTWSANYAAQGPLAPRRALFSDAVGRAVWTGGRALDLGCGTGELARQLAASGRRVTEWLCWGVRASHGLQSRCCVPSQTRDTRFAGWNGYSLAWHELRRSALPPCQNRACTPKSLTCGCPGIVARSAGGGPASGEWGLHVLNDLHRISKPSPLCMLTLKRSTNSVEHN
jgi:hypothetical protein